MTRRLVVICWGSRLLIYSPKLANILKSEYKSLSMSSLCLGVFLMSVPVGVFT
jgi:hypothetical protein